MTGLLILLLSVVPALSAGGHWTQGFTDQYGDNAQTRQVALADVTGPGTEYLRELDAAVTGDVTYGKEAEFLDVQYHEVTKQTGVLTKAIIAVASGGNAWLSFGLNTVADATISGEINLENIVKDAAFTVVTAGFDVGGVEFQGATNWTKNALNVPSVYNPITGTRTAGYFSGSSLQNIAVDAGTNSLSQTAFYGGSLKDNLGNSLQAGLINEGTGFAQNFVGDIKGPDGSPIGVIGHGIVGCISADVSGGNCGRGAVNAAAGEIATAWADKAYGQDRDKVKDLIGNTVNPILAAATSGGDVGQYSINQGITDSQLQNNYLTHAQRDMFLLLLSTCDADEECISKWAQNYSELSDKNNAKLAETIATGDLDKIDELRVQIPTDLLEYQIYVSSLLKDDPRAAGEFANVLNEGSVVNINGNLITASDATFYALRDGHYSKNDVDSLVALGVSEFGPMGMSPNLAGLLGARGIIGMGRGVAIPESPGSYSFKFKFPTQLDTSKWMISDRRAYNSLGKRVSEHQQKLANFKKNPTIRPGMENQSPETVQQQQQARIRHLEQEIAEFQRQREALIKKYE